MANANAGNPVGAQAQVAPPPAPPQQQAQQAVAMNQQAQAAPLMEINERFFSYMSDLMDNRITIHKGQQITINDEDNEETLQLCREFPKYGLRLKEQEELAPRMAKLVICKCGIIDKEGNIPTKLLLTGESTTGLYIPRLVTQAKDDTVYAIIENQSDEFLELHANQEIGQALPLRTMKIGKQLVYETPESDEGMYFLHNDTLKEHILLGNVDSVLPTPRGYEESRQPRTIDIKAIKADGLTEEQVQKLKQILKRFEGVFSTGPGDFGKTPLMSFRIETGDAKPYAARYYPIPLGYRAEVKEEFKNMKKNGIVEDANSPWSSNLVIVKKRNGKLRICANLKGVNALTLRTTSFPINFQEESLYKLSGGKYYFRIDLSQAYYAIPIDDPEHRVAWLEMYLRN